MRSLALPRFRHLLLTLALGLSAACSGDGAGQDETHHTEHNISIVYVADFDKLNAKFPGDWPMTKIEDAFTVRVKLGEFQVDAPTHLFEHPVTLIPYANEDGTEDASGERVDNVDAMIAEVYPPGEIGFAVKHHRPEFRTLSMTDADPNGMKEHFKLQDTHIEIVVGVESGGVARAITLNNPQNYENGRFGTDHYPMIFVKPKYPSYLSQDQKRIFNDNIRSMAVAFNAVSNFPGDYNGGDPLGARNPEQVMLHAAMMVRAIAGDETAVEWFKKPENMIYCAELAHVASSAGLLAPLNEATFVPLVGQETWDAFVKAVETHNENPEGSTFVARNSNKRVADVKLTLAPKDLKPAPSYAGGAAAQEAQKLAFKPMTMADIVEQFLRTHIPREQGFTDPSGQHVSGEKLAPMQGAILAKMKPGLYEAMALDKLPPGAESDAIKAKVDELFDALVKVVSTPFADYATFRAKLEPLMQQARQMTGPRADNGVGLFVPPSLLHVIAQGKHLGGLLDLEYVGHGLHYSLLRKKSVPTPPPVEPTPTEPVTPTEPASAKSCKDHCGAQSADQSCWCDTQCASNGDCCTDVATHCAAATPTEPTASDSCVGHCGEQAPSGCWCDDTCTQNGDCCADRAAACGG
jgi:hypothetical protein